MCLPSENNTFPAPTHEAPCSVSHSETSFSLIWFSYIISENFNSETRQEFPSFRNPREVRAPLLGHTSCCCWHVPERTWSTWHHESPGSWRLTRAAIEIKTCNEWGWQNLDFTVKMLQLQTVWEPNKVLGVFGRQVGLPSPFLHEDMTLITVFQKKYSSLY